MTPLDRIYDELGITPTHLSYNRLPRCEQPWLSHLRVAEIDWEGKPFVLHMDVADGWQQMAAAAGAEAIPLRPFSGFRSYAHQKRLIERHLKNGRPLEEILTHIAIPGFSEHHTGRAVDLHADGRFVLEEQFEKTSAFAWLSQNAGRYGFRLSYPRRNDLGIIYEPWHWYYVGK
ncbi:MAG: D-alanyl-D-alanine carboxypeptidase family protein [Bdellovibrionales bacterium]